MGAAFKIALEATLKNNNMETGSSASPKLAEVDNVQILTSKSASRMLNNINFNLYQSDKSPPFDPYVTYRVAKKLKREIERQNLSENE